MGARLGTGAGTIAVDEPFALGPHSLVRRAKIVLMAADGHTNGCGRDDGCLSQPHGSVRAEYCIRLLPKVLTRNRSVG